MRYNDELNAKNFEKNLIDSLNKFKLLTEDKKKELYDLMMIGDHTITKRKIRSLLSKILYEGLDFITIFSYKTVMRYGYCEEDAKKISSQYQSENSKKFRQKYNETPENYNQNLNTRIEFWLHHGYTLEEAKSQLQERQRTFTLEKCIKKHGVEEGTRIHKERQERWQKTLYENNDMNDVNRRKGKTREELIERHGTERANEIIKSRTRHTSWFCASKESLNVFIPLYKILRRRGIQRDDISFGIKGSIELLLHDNNSIFLYDFTINSKKIIIEFHGIKFHPKSKDSDWTDIFQKITVEEAYNKDQYKKQLAESQGYKVLEIWSDEDKDTNLEKCLSFIEMNW